MRGRRVRLSTAAAGFLVGFFGWLYAGMGVTADGSGLVSAPEALERSIRGELTLIDVRSPPEWRSGGIPRGAKAVTIHQRGGKRAFLNEILKAVDGDRSRPVALICASGVRSTRAAAILGEAGFTNVENILEGMEGSAAGPGWRRRGLPLEAWSPPAPDSGAGKLPGPGPVPGSKRVLGGG